jgi:hypothetical protein
MVNLHGHGLDDSLDLCNYRFPGIFRGRLRSSGW